MTTFTVTMRVATPGAPTPGEIGEAIEKALVGTGTWLTAEIELIEMKVEEVK